MSKKTFIKKVCDNIVHGLILVLPKGAAIHKLLFSVKDARESTEKEDAYQELMKKLESKVEQLSSIDKEMIVPLFNTLFEWIKEKKSDLEYNQILCRIESLKSLPGFKGINVVLQNELLSYEAEVNLRLGNQKVAQELSEQILSKQRYSIRICDYLLYYASIIKNKPLFEDILLKYQSLGATTEKITLKEVIWQYMSGNNKAVLNLLCQNDSYTSIKEEFIESSNANFFVGLALFHLKKYDLAKQYLKNAYEKEKTYIHKYYQLLNEAFEVIDRRSAKFLITESERKILISVLKELSSDGCVEYFGKEPSQLKEEYWHLRITVALHIDDKVGLDEYQKCPEELKNSPGVKGIYADILSFNDKSEEANKILLELYSVTNDFRFITKILNTYLQSAKYEEALTFSGSIKKFDDEGIIYSLIIEAYAKLNEIEKVVEFAKEKIASCKYPIYIYLVLGDIYFATGDFSEANKWYSKIITAIPTEDYEPRILFAKHLRTRNRIDLCLQILQPYLKYSYEAQKLFVYDAVKPENEKYFGEADEIIKKNITGDSDEIFWISCKVELAFNRKRYHTSQEYLKKLYKLDKRSEIVFRLAYLELLLGGKDVVELMYKLENEINPDFVMIAANCYYALGDYERAENLSLKSMALNGNNFNEHLYAQFIGINVAPKPGMPEITELDEVLNDCTILLESDSQQVWIGITSRSELLVKDNQYKFADIKFFFRTDESVIHLIGTKKNELVVFDKVNWRIKEIWGIKTKVFNHCILEYTSKVPNSKFLQLVELKEDNPIESMMHFLVESEIYENQILADYNFRNGVGLPLKQFAVRTGKNIIDTLLYLLNKPNQSFFTGELNLISFEERKILLSPSSISLLSLIGVLDFFISTYCDQLLVLESTKKYFIDIVDKMNTKEFAVSMSVGTDQGRFIRTEYTEDFKRKRTKFFNEIIQALSKVAVTIMELRPEELDEMSKYIALISR
ncbi:MAG: hypothetical protein LC102_01840 [Ignavibacteriales bacterium]|nr:MAG: hypothetical protein F9K26_04410 [Ignavibacteriaceae bacterium]MBW7873464.1 hypothetical protein [Ignavibacteria bacterium]MCZ2142155.1 hypothetical protein [Ignavibacteriales bacterium]MBV6444890.1 hypothetical protein [Ignavibacteriaceae bacterium]MBZ0197065.1 hypothetical protein [Ignavibacteriaceae bacterium]